MLDESHSATFKNLKCLLEYVRNRNKPLLMWIGAGVGRWAGYPGWAELAEQFHQRFSHEAQAYNSAEGLRALGWCDYPRLFQLCKDADAYSYKEQLIHTFQSRPPGPVFERFVRELKRISPLCLITTNVEQSLEQHVGGLDVIQRSDIERAVQSIQQRHPFLLKLHGCSSSIDSIVMASSDYESLCADKAVMAKLMQLAADVTILFIGYGLRDDHVVASIVNAQHENSVFGAGPHFAVLDDGARSLPLSVRTIKYVPEPHADHRDVIAVVTEVANIDVVASEVVQSDVQSTQANTGAIKSRQSAHLLWDVYPPGTWETSAIVNIVSDDNTRAHQAIIGNGFSQVELQTGVSSAMHELVVALLSYDHVYAAITAVGRIHTLLGSAVFWQLVDDGTLRFLSWEHQETIVYPAEDSLADGDLGSFAIFNADRTAHTVRDIVGRQLRPVPGREHEASRHLDRLAEKTQIVSAVDEGFIPGMVRGLLLLPTVRKLLRISPATPTNSIPRWYAFPVLRLANVVKTGMACRLNGIASVKLDYGAAALVGPAMSYDQGSGHADRAVEYVLAGRYGENLGAIVQKEPSVLDKIVRLRGSQAGINLREAVFASLATNDGQQIEAAINGAIRRAVPESILQEARDAFLQMFTPSVPSTLPLLWNNLVSADEGLKRWALRSRSVLESECTKRKIGEYDLCPCRSGEKLKFCCHAALRV